MGFITEIVNQIKSDKTEENIMNKHDFNDNIPWENISSRTTDKKLTFFENISKNPKLAATIGLVGVVAIISCVALFNFFNRPSTLIEKDENSQANVNISVHVTGEVLSPGVYNLDAGARIIDAVNKAGGFSQNAIKDDINLAKVLSDGEQIIIKSKEANESSNTNSNISTDSETNSSKSKPTEQNNGKININKANSSELQTINGIGPSTAQKIIDYRNTNGKFQSINDIKNVSGIGEKTFAKFKDKICI